MNNKYGKLTFLNYLPAFEKLKEIFSDMENAGQKAANKALTTPSPCSCAVVKRYKDERGIFQ